MRIVVLAGALAGSVVACQGEEAEPDGAGGADGDADDSIDSGGAPPSGEGPIIYTFAPLESELELTLSSDAGGQTGSVSVPAASVPEELQPTEYYFSKFRFESALGADESYELTLGSVEANQSCAVFLGPQGTGAEAMVEGALRVGCEWTYDYLSRSTDSSAFGNVTRVGVGGSAEPIGEQEGLGEGRFVVFRSSQAGLDGNDGSVEQIFWRDRLRGITQLVSRAPGGAEGDYPSSDPVISADGLTVAFSSEATNLVEDDTNEVRDIFVWSALDETLERVSVGPDGEEADAGSATPTLSGDGKIIAFGTNSLTVVPTADDSTLNQKIVRIDLSTGERDVVSRHMTSGYPVDGSYPMLSEDGDRLVFQSFRDVTGDINTYSWDIFLYEHSSGEVRPLTLTPEGAAHDGEGTCVSCGTAPAISGDGKWVTFTDGSTNLGVDGGRIHVWLVEVDACDVEGGCNVVAIDRAADGSSPDADAPNWAAPLSYDGRFVAFATSATNLVTPAASQQNVYLFDRDAADDDERLRPITTIDEGSSGTERYTALSRGGAYLVFRADGHLDPRVASGGAYAAFTGVGDAFSWYRGPLE